MEYQKTNREKSRRARLGYYYCHGCDKAMVAIGGKCHLCGHRRNKKGKIEKK